MVAGRTPSQIGALGSRRHSSPRRSVGRCRKLRRSDIYIVRQPDYKRPKPRRGGSGRLGAVHAAPTELDPGMVGAFTISIWLLRSWPWVRTCQQPKQPWPNQPAQRVARGGCRLCFRVLSSAAIANFLRSSREWHPFDRGNTGRFSTLAPECRSPTRQALRNAKKHAGSEIGAPQALTSRGRCQDAAGNRRGGL
jgi:hypothetical protein